MLAVDDRAFVQYMTASCLRQLGKRSEAAVLYRDVADAKDDEFLAECAVWQLTSVQRLFIVGLRTGGSRGLGATLAHQVPELPLDVGPPGT